MSYGQSFVRSHDYYRILQVSQTATLAEIKTAYRKLALELHPDRHSGCPQKQAQFQKVNEAYQFLLTDVQTRQRRGGSGGAGAPNFQQNAAYRKVYAPRPPPEWKFTWNHDEHREMHYGRGQEREALKDAFRDGLPKYSSPLGRGFAFSTMEDKNSKTGGTENNENINNEDPYVNVNPFSKRSPQGPPKVVVDYEEGEFDPAQSGKVRVTRQERIVHDMHSRRSQRLHNHMHQQQQQSSSRPPQGQYAQYHRFRTDGDQVDGINTTFVGRKYNGGNHNTNAQRPPSSGDCVIL